MTCSKTIEQHCLSPSNGLDLQKLGAILYRRKQLSISEETKSALQETNGFINYLLEKNIKVYGITTGFADLRDKVVQPHQAAELSKNMISSHDAGIGKYLDLDVVLGAMIICSNSLSKGHSGIRLDSLETLVSMVNERIIPLIPDTGSLGASGDLAFLARLGNCMSGEEVPVNYNGTEMLASEALKQANIQPFKPKAKEGLALINGTAFMASMAAISFYKQVHFVENLFSLMGLFLPAVGAIDAAFYGSIHNIRKQSGQAWVAKVIRSLTMDSPFIDRESVQDDYCIRCIPQIFGPKMEMLFEAVSRIEKEIDAVTDNPLIFKEDKITPDIALNRIISFKGAPWAVISGGNFHGEYMSTYADVMRMCNAKLALTIERQITYMLNPSRNKGKLPTYLIADPQKAGLYSGYMIAQYTANALVQKIAYLGNPVSTFNLTSANESEDVVSYGATSCQKLLEQIEFLNELLAIYLNVVMQAYAITRKNITDLPSHIFSEKLFSLIQNGMDLYQFPIDREEIFHKRYDLALKLLSDTEIRKCADFPVVKQLNSEGKKFLSSEFNFIYKN